MGSRYLTVARPGEAVVREKMSRFLAFAIPVTSAGEARAEISRLINEYHDARHVCWAYMVGAERTEYQLTDNGEPSGTAGKPILGQINSLGLTNVAVIVVRYFGGIKLGTPGLIAAYRQAAREALEAAGTAEGCEMTDVTFRFPYLAMNDVMKIIKQLGLDIVDQQFDNTCTITLSVATDTTGDITARMAGAGAQADPLI